MSRKHCGTLARNFISDTGINSATLEPAPRTANSTEMNRSQYGHSLLTDRSACNKPARYRSGWPFVLTVDKSGLHQEQTNSYAYVRTRRQNGISDSWREWRERTSERAARAVLMAGQPTSEPVFADSCSDRLIRRMWSIQGNHRSSITVDWMLKDMLSEALLVLLCWSQYICGFTFNSMMSLRRQSITPLLRTYLYYACYNSCMQQ